MDVRKTKEGYVVEGDILLTAENLASTASSLTLRIAGTEQYRTTNLVGSLPRVITVSTSGLPATYTAALDEAIARYNALNLRITFQRVGSNGEIGIEYANLELVY
ncbi:zinc-dependent metalloprotease [Chitinophaga nivalis]|uniref:Zinc-dependent metalloprotease n=1 Tax=Chitinophaga nivalis TaxID=2991709 RepID=A0ABT3IHI4_9BACT|nr:zinc-dependent metalloprotease [Chitinophaga nivalis]MCW3483219.1 zinc-dependent metalloprotease [Chitinophaga nivalis]